MFECLQQEDFVVRESRGFNSDEDVIRIGDRWNWKCEEKKIKRYMELLSKR